MSILEPEQPLEVNNDFYVAYNDYVMENYTEKQGRVTELLQKMRSCFLGQGSSQAI
jgi:hypothetical protein